MPMHTHQVNIGFFVMAVYIMRKHTKRQTKTSHLKSLALVVYCLASGMHLVDTSFLSLGNG